ncbi:PH domain-containing protein [Micromonospora sediminicola]|uniref:PH domain-containing protein n=1 Tax=Micromonospora sediminicola TaxID=946078 RepID=UPI0037B131A3
MDFGGQMQATTPGGQQWGAAPELAQVVVRPRRLRWISLAAAAVILGINVFSAVTLSGTTSNGGTLFPADRWAVAGVGVFFAALALVPWRLRVQADTRHVRVRSFFGDHTIPWELVDRVRFDRKALWASLELTSGEPLPLLAVQVIDRDEAVTAVQRLRRLHAAHGAEAPASTAVEPLPPVG